VQEVKDQAGRTLEMGRLKNSDTVNFYCLNFKSLSVSGSTPIFLEQCMKSKVMEIEHLNRHSIILQSG
jgi:hypothetical protein